MNNTEAAVLLAKVQAYDRRSVGRADVEAWAEVMTKNNIRLVDAMEAVSDYFGEATEWLMPAHLIQRVSQIRKARLQNAPVMVIPKDLHQAVERQWARAFTDAVKDADPDPHATADAAMGITRKEEIELQRDMSVLQLKPRSA